MSVVDWLILVIWGILAGEFGLEMRKRRWGAAAISGVFLAVVTYMVWPMFRYLAGVVASWF